MFRRIPECDKSTLPQSDRANILKRECKRTRLFPEIIFIEAEDFCDGSDFQLRFPTVELASVPI